MNELYHHGVKGMKWGVRKNKSTAGSSYNPNNPYDAKAMYKAAEQKAANRLKKESGQKAVKSMIDMYGWDSVLYSEAMNDFIDMQYDVYTKISKRRASGKKLTPQEEEAYSFLYNELN